MERSERIKIAVLTSSRADFGIYLPLLKELKSDGSFELTIIAFGTHLSPYHGHTVDDILQQGMEVKHRITSMLLHDDAGSIASAYALTAMKFADFWTEHHNFDYVLCVGDRYEMAAAVMAGVPLGIKFAHIHGGETTLGAIDNIYRNSITMASDLHFVSTGVFRDRVLEMVGANAKCFVVGALSLDNLEDVTLCTPSEFQEKWNIDLSKPFILVTVHPETIAFDRNSFFADETFAALSVLAKERRLVITMPNADTNGQLFRSAFQRLEKEIPGQVNLIENFGTQSYFTSMKYADLLIGNTSSGIIEAASFGRYVLDLGDRQKGRLAGDNVVHVPFEKMAIVTEARKLLGANFAKPNLFKIGRASMLIKQSLKSNVFV